VLRRRRSVRRGGGVGGGAYEEVEMDCAEDEEGTRTRQRRNVPRRRAQGVGGAYKEGSRNEEDWKQGGF